MVIMCISKFGLVSYCELHVSCVRDVNYRDRLAVAVVRSGVIVGHIPRKILSICSMSYRWVGVLASELLATDVRQGG